MKIYKIAQISFPVWLGKEFEKIRSNPESQQEDINIEMNPYNIQQIREWVNETSPDLTNMSFQDAKNEADDYFFNKESKSLMPNNLTINDLNMEKILNIINSYRYSDDVISQHYVIKESDDIVTQQDITKIIIDKIPNENTILKNKNDILMDEIFRITVIIKTKPDDIFVPYLLYTKTGQYFEI